MTGPELFSVVVVFVVAVISLVFILLYAAAKDWEEAETEDLKRRRHRSLEIARVRRLMRRDVNDL